MSSKTNVYIIAENIVQNNFYKLLEDNKKKINYHSKPNI